MTAPAHQPSDIPPVSPVRPVRRAPSSSPTRPARQATAARFSARTVPATTDRHAPDTQQLTGNPPGRAPFVLLVLVLAAAGLVTLVLLTTAISENAFRLHDLQKGQQALDLEEQELQQEASQLDSPGSLAASARRLGLIPAGKPAFLELPSGRILGVAAPAASHRPQGSPR